MIEKVTSFGLPLIIITILSFCECITLSLPLSLEKIKLIAIVNGIFHVSFFLRLLMMSFKYGLILLTYCSTDSVVFLSPILSYLI